MWWKYFEEIERKRSRMWPKWPIIGHKRCEISPNITRFLPKPPKCATLHSETRDFSRIVRRFSAKFADLLPNSCPILGNFLKKFARKISRKSGFARLLEHFLIFLMWNLHILWSDFWKMREITCFSPNHDQWVIELSKIHFSRKSDPTRL